jgi:pyruvate/2-oxoglutarate dehydrogenase complex dihydrolipoamide acyltransferase (E2) component
MARVLPRVLCAMIPASRPIGEQQTMSVEIVLPKIGFSMNEGQVAEWLVEDGGAVAEGQPLYALEADKSTNEVESPASGILRITTVVGETYEVGTILGYIE